MRFGRVALGQAFGDRVRGHRAGGQGQQHSGGIEWIEEAESVADQRPAVAGGLCRAVGIFLRGPEDVAARGILQPHRQAGAALDLLEVDRFQILAGPVEEEVVVGGDDADAEHVVVQRDIPEPAVFALGLHDESRSLIAAGVAVGALPVGPKRRFLERWVPLAQPQPRHDQRRLAAGIDHDLGAHLALAAVLALHAHADRALTFEQHFDHARAFVDLHAMFASIVQHELIELATADLPGLR